jgi:hypothetical protein
MKDVMDKDSKFESLVSELCIEGKMPSEAPAALEASKNLQLD